MASSFAVFDSVVEQLLSWLQPTTAVDIGAGAGKYGHMLAQVAPACRCSAVEANADYVERFQLAQRYQSVWTGSAADWQEQALNKRYDLAILGNVLEHGSKSAGLDLLNFLSYRSAYTLIISPEFLTMGDEPAPPHEALRSIWSERDMAWHEHWAWENCRSVSLLLLRGYLPAPVSLDDLVERMNAAAVPIHDFADRAVKVRAARLRRVSLGRETSYRLA
ncbi:class I SAM-dependent methyltransferase [Roseateles koreensis]|uniref:Class I SAM-dependent methyltransferase n=1 Tax=Roseateles koreensis TaxID=2987526 RepID=A0ABT5KMA6_9BURK|nr:class I SAM-dependent methyltransferase [Roseateles koreensis]MDC8784038.1 class I SAM-dependent methyltransferase [Roseateles koreensis]